MIMEEDRDIVTAKALLEQLELELDGGSFNDDGYALPIDGK